MRSLAAGSFAQISEFEQLWKAYRICRRGRSRRLSHSEFALDADATLLHLERSLRNGRFEPDPLLQRLVRDPKLRLIATPSVRDRILHQSIVLTLAPTLERSFVHQSYAACKRRGPFRAILAAIQGHRRAKFRLHLDIRRYFPSIDRSVLLRLFEERVKDSRTIGLLAQILHRGGAVYQSPEASAVLAVPEGSWPKERGIPLGSSLSQWCGNFFLNGLDHFVLRSMKPIRYLRYMDDFVLFDDDRAHLLNLREAITKWLREERRLELNPKHLEVAPTRSPCVFLGWRISKAGWAPSRKLRRRFKARVAVAARRGPEALERTLTAYRGLLLW